IEMVARQFVDIEFLIGRNDRDVGNLVEIPDFIADDRLEPLAPRVNGGFAWMESQDQAVGTALNVADRFDNPFDSPREDRITLDDVPIPDDISEQPVNRSPPHRWHEFGGESTPINH